MCRDASNQRWGGSLSLLSMACSITLRTLILNAHLNIIWFLPIFGNKVWHFLRIYASHSRIKAPRVQTKDFHVLSGVGCSFIYVTMFVWPVIKYSKKRKQNIKVELKWKLYTGKYVLGYTDTPSGKSQTNINGKVIVWTLLGAQSVTVEFDLGNLPVNTLP